MKKMKIAFYLDDIDKNVDYYHEHQPNPGIGGTQFLIWSISCGLSERKNELDVILFTKENAKFPGHLCSVQVEDIYDCIKKAAEMQIEYLVLRSPIIDTKVFEIITYYKVKTILWAHNFDNFRSFLASKDNEYVVKNVCVSREQLDLLVDTDLYKKSTYIYNGLWFDEYKYEQKKNDVVCYMGNLYPHSGYEAFLKAWCDIEKRCPKASLVIIGGLNLYNFNVMKPGFSKRGFERIKRLEKKYLYDEDGLKDNVKFTGVLRGTEKLNVMSSATIAVANITDAGETFGLGAIEFQGLGIPVVSINKYGLKETVQNRKTGFLVKNRRYLSSAVCSLLENSNVVNQFSMQAKEFVRDHFSMEQILDEWESLLKDVDNYGNYAIDKRRFTCTEKKKYYVNYKIRTIIKFAPPVLFYKYIGHCFIRLLEKLDLY